MNTSRKSSRLNTVSFRHSCTNFFTGVAVNLQLDDTHTYHPNADSGEISHSISYNVAGHLIGPAGQHIPNQLAGFGHRNLPIDIDAPENLPAIYSNAKHACWIPATMLISTWSSNTTALENIKWLDF